MAYNRSAEPVKAAGIDGMPAELLKRGPFSMMGCLASLFTSILNGKYPEQP